MRKAHLVVIALLLSVQIGWTQAGVRLSVSKDGWTIAVNADQSTLNISREDLGTVLKEVRLNLRGADGLHPMGGWTVEKKGESGIIIRTSEPRSTWILQLEPHAFRISTTAADGVLTAVAPAPPSRIVARLLDPQGTPVNWMMTAETKNFFGGVEAIDPSYLPRRNPDVIYFSLGQVAASNLHSLFDRKTDTAIDFPEQTSMQRAATDTDLLALTIPVPGNAQIRFISDYFTKTLGLPHYVPFDDTYFPSAPMVWDSWSSYYEKVREEDIVRNTDWISANLKAFGFQYIQLDDGYDRGKDGEHYWIENWDQKQFPHGPKWLTDYIKSKGLLPGLWLVPSAYAGAVKDHPEWYLRYKKDGSFIPDYNTPTLDYTNPEVLDFLKKELTTLNDWGFEYYKFDGEHDFLKYVPGIDLDKIANKSVDPIMAYRNRLKLIRDTVGPKRFIEGCPAGTPLDGIGYFNSYYTGEDTYNTWRGMYSLFSSISGNAFLNHLAVYVMPGEMGIEPPMTEDEARKRKPSIVVDVARDRELDFKGFGTTLPEARTVLTHVALSGVVYSLGSPMAELPQERVKLLKMTLPTMPILPIDLFSRGTDMPMWFKFKETTADDYVHNYPEIIDLKVNAAAGTYDVAALTNWRSWTSTRQLAFADKLGLNPDASYVVFDSWSQKLLGVFKGRMDVTIDPHDTRVLLIHPVMNRPQLVGTSRHITGAYSIRELAWNSSNNELRGTSDTVPGDDNTLSFYVPNGFRVARVRVVSKDKREIPARQEMTGNALKISFTGQQQTVDWVVEFAGNSGNTQHLSASVH